MEYIEETTDEVAARSESEKIKLIHEVVKKVRVSEKLGVKLMQKWEEEAMIRARAHEEGLSEGLSQGLSQGRREVLIEMVRDGELTVDAAAKRAGMSAEEFEKEMLLSMI